MDLKDILKKCDHTLLSQDATWPQIKKLCDEGIKYNTATICIPPYFVKKAKEYTKGKLKVCTVIGFPNGYTTTGVKVVETYDAINSGADEIDMVINMSMVKERHYIQLKDEINKVKTACSGKPLKVIIETCLLTEKEIIDMCRVVSDTNADYIKTSTGFSTGGATIKDVKLMSENISGKLKIKASGGISTIKEAEEFLSINKVDRLGTSRIVKIAKEMERERAAEEKRQRKNC